VTGLIFEVYMYQVNKGINIDYAETLIRDFLAEGYNLYEITDLMHLPLRQILDILTRRIN
jgi:1,2-phenylacetyl-CoA epoxidase catalytic subunit